MYLRYFGFSAQPFSTAPDPRALYLSAQHREALATLLYVARSGGFALLTGDVGCGKTTVCRCLLDQLPDGVDVALVFNPKLSAVELLATICDEFGIAYPATGAGIKTLVDRLNRHLLDGHARGRTALLIIDEAQTLSIDALELIRLLTNLETSARKLLQVILVGQSELRTLLARPELRQLAQRVTAHAHLGPLAGADIEPYVRHRLRIGGVEAPLFTARALARVHRASAGIPRLINALCDRALLGACVERRWRVTPAIVDRAARELFDARRGAVPARAIAAAGALLLAAAVAGGGVLPRAGLGDLRAEAALAMPPPPPAVAAEPSPLPASPPTAAEAPDPWPEPPPAPASATRRAAFAAVLGQWGVSAALGDGEPCREAIGHGLRCFAGAGTLDHLRRYNRPAVLTLHDERGGSFEAALLRIGAATAEIGVDGRTARVPLAELAARWTGAYTVFWRPPPGFDGAASLAAAGTALAPWALARLAELDGGGLPPEVGAPATLAPRLRRFQADRGLPADGRLDARTVVELALLDPDGPLLAVLGGGSP